MNGLIPTRSLRRRIPWLCVALCTGCIFPKSVGDGPDDSSSGEPSPSETSTGADGFTSTATISAHSTSDDGSDNASDATSEGTSESSGDTGTATESVCDPQPNGARVEAWLNEPGPPVANTIELDTSCEILSITTIDDPKVIEFVCDTGSGPLTLNLELYTYDAVFTWPIAAGQTLDVRMYSDITIDSGRELYLALSEPGGDLRLGYYASNAFLAAPAVDITGWYAPLGLQLAEGVCDREPYTSPPMGGSFIIELCGFQVERQAFDVQLDGGRAQRVFDGRRETVGAYDVWVGSAQRLYPQEPECGTMTPQDRTSVLMLASP